MAPEKIKLTTSWDDYSEHNERLALMLLKYKIPVIWFIECNQKEAWNQIVEYDGVGFEIGSHTVNHQLLRPCDKETQWYEISESKAMIENVINKPVEWFCYPRGRYSEETVKMVKKAGYKYARTTSLGKVDKRNPHKLKTTGHIYQRKEYNFLDFYSWIQNQLLKGETDIHIWGHAQEIEKHNDWDKLKDLFQYLEDNYDWDKLKQ